MRFVVDAQLPRGLCRWLSERGHHAVHVNAVWAQPASDRAIAAYAEREGAVVISKDEDFVSLRLPDRFVLIRLRCGNASNRGLTAWLDPQWPEVEARLAAGARFVTLG